MIDCPTPSAYCENFTKFDDLFVKYAQISGVPVEMLKTICMVESSLGRDPSAARGLLDPNDIEGSKSKDGLSWGIMQLTVKTARDFDLLVSAVKLNNPEYSINIASQFLARLSRQFKGVEEDIVRAYNEGAKARKNALAGLEPDKADEYWRKYQVLRSIL